MKPTLASCWLLALLSPAVALSAETPSAPLPPGVAHGQLTDGSSLRLTILDKEIVLDTDFGKLLIPLSAIERIDLGLRLSEATRREIDTLIDQLGSGEFADRQEAEKRLLALGEKAYPAVLQLSKKEDNDVEVLRRAQSILTRLEEKLTEEQRALPEHDVVHTSHSRIAGRVESESLAVKTTPFGEVKLHLEHVRSLRLREREPAYDPALVTDAPPNVFHLKDQIGKSFYFRMTGTNQGGIYGTGVYTADSMPAMAAVHMGILRVGEVGVVKLTMVAPPPAFAGSTQNGVTSSPYGAYPAAYRLDRVRR